MRGGARLGRLLHPNEASVDSDVHREFSSTRYLFLYMVSYGPALRADASSCTPSVVVLRPSSQRPDHELDDFPPRRSPRLHHELVLAQPPGPSEPPRGRGGGGGGGGETVLIAGAAEPRSRRRGRGSDGPESSLRTSSSRVERTVPRVAADRRRGRPSSLAAAPVRPRRPLVLPPRAEALPSVVEALPSSRAHPHYAGTEPRRSRAALLAAARRSEPRAASAIDASGGGVPRAGGVPRVGGGGVVFVFVGGARRGGGAEPGAPAEDLFPPRRGRGRGADAAAEQAGRSRGRAAVLRGGSAAGRGRAEERGRGRGARRGRRRRGGGAAAEEQRRVGARARPGGARVRGVRVRAGVPRAARGRPANGSVRRAAGVEPADRRRHGGEPRANAPFRCAARDGGCGAERAFVPASIARSVAQSLVDDDPRSVLFRCALPDGYDGCFSRRARPPSGRHAPGSSRLRSPDARAARGSSPRAQRTRRLATATGAPRARAPRGVSRLVVEGARNRKSTAPPSWLRRRGARDAGGGARPREDGGVPEGPKRAEVRARRPARRARRPEPRTALGDPCTPFGAPFSRTPSALLTGDPPLPSPPRPPPSQRHVRGPDAEDRNPIVGVHAECVLDPRAGPARARSLPSRAPRPPRPERQT